MRPEYMDYETVWAISIDGGEPVRLGPIRDVALIPAYGKPVKVVFENGSSITTLASPSEVFMMPTEDEAALNDLDLLEVL